MDFRNQTAGVVVVQEEVVIEAGGLSRHAEELDDGEEVTSLGECAHNYFAASLQVWNCEPKKLMVLRGTEGMLEELSVSCLFEQIYLS